MLLSAVPVLMACPDAADPAAQHLKVQEVEKGAVSLNESFAKDLAEKLVLREINDPVLRFRSLCLFCFLSRIYVFPL